MVAAIMATDLLLTDAPQPTDHDAIVAGLIAFNRAATGRSDGRPLAVLIRDAEGATIGGLWGWTGLDWLHVELLYVPDDLRGTGTGRDLMQRAEVEARARGCRGIWLDTFSFQARGFYEKLGFEAFGQIDDYPAGHQRFFMRKRF